jgi:hypothetical protein
MVVWASGKECLKGYLAYGFAIRLSLCLGLFFECVCTCIGLYVGPTRSDPLSSGVTPKAVPVAYAQRSQTRLATTLSQQATPQLLILRRRQFHPIKIRTTTFFFLSPLRPQCEAPMPCSFRVSDWIFSFLGTVIRTTCMRTVRWAARLRS